MKKRSALTLAGAVVAAFAAGVLALTVNTGLLKSSEASTGPGKLERKPIVRTIKVHRQAEPKGGPVQTVVLPSSSQSSAGAGSYEDDDAYEHEDEHEDESHEFGEEDDD
jgi:hypothetical protein